MFLESQHKTQIELWRQLGVKMKEKEKCVIYSLDGSSEPGNEFLNNRKKCLLVTKKPKLDKLERKQQT